MRIRISFFVLFFLLHARWAAAADPISLTAPATAVSTSAAGVPLNEVAMQSEDTLVTLHDMQNELASVADIEQIANELPPLSREINARLQESSKILALNPSLATFRRMERGWREANEDLDDWNKTLSKRVARIDNQTKELDQLDETWRQTLVSAQSAQAPISLIQNIHAVLSLITTTRTQVQKRHKEVLALQVRVGRESTRAEQMLAMVRHANEDALSRLFVRDSSPIWRYEANTETTLMEQGRGSFSNQMGALAGYAHRKGSRFLIHLIVFLALVIGVYWFRRGVYAWTVREPQFASAVKVFEHPLAVALVLSLLFRNVLYPQAPRILWAIWGASALIPAILILRALIERRFYPILNALVIFYLVDQIRAITEALPFVSRVLFLAEMLGGFLFFIWLVRSAGWAIVASSDRLTSALKRCVQIALWIFPIAFIANTVGYLNLANLLGHAILGSSYVAVTLYATVRIADVLLIFLLSVRPMNFLGLVHRRRDGLVERLRGLLRFAGFLLWGLITLQLLSVRAPFFYELGKAMHARLTVGSISLSLGNIVAFAVTVWAAFLVSRIVRFILEEDVYPRLSLSQGLPYAISTLLHYGILFGGFLMAIAALGFDMNKFTILAGAFGVGVGFGTQNIINNFVSGLILLFERPIKVGDVVQIDDATGVVRRIGIRATVVRTASDSEIIVPNGSLISNRVINWTSNSRQHMINLPISVAGTSNPSHVMEILKKAASAHPLVSKTPAPQAFLIKPGAGALDFELHVWSSHVEELTQIRSDLAVAISTALANEKVSLS